MGTPPRLWATLGPQPMARLALSRLPVAGHAPPSATLSALAFGRALDAAQRSDAEFFLPDEPTLRTPATRVAGMLKAVLAPRYGTLARAFEAGDPVEVGIGLDRLRAILLGAAAEDPAFSAVDAAGLGACLLSALAQDDDLSPAAVGRILLFAALDAYLYRGATPRARRTLEAHRELIYAATGRREQAVNQDEDIGVGLSVWEGWVAVRALTQLFGVRELDDHFTRRGEPALVLLTRCAEIIVGAVTGPTAGADELASLERVLQLAGLEGRVPDPQVLLPLGPGLGQSSPSPSPARSPAAPPPARTAWRRRLAEVPRATTRVREIEALLEDLSGLVERYELLLHGDDSGLVFEVAPVLQDSLQARYSELKQHPRLLAGLLEGAELSPQAERHAQAFAALLARADVVEARFRDLRAALGAGALEVGYATDAPPSRRPAPPPEPPFASPALRRAAQVLEAALVTPHLAAWSHVERAHTPGAASWRLRRVDAPKRAFGLTAEPSPSGDLRLHVSHGNRVGAPSGVRKGTFIDGAASGLFEGSDAPERLAACLASILSTEPPDEEP